jgi:hypothetical protein
MSRRESEREDLLREATALKERAELQIPGCEEPIVIGFRASGAASVYFGADPVYQFNTSGQLRRAYIGGRLYKAERGRLIALNRQRAVSETTLVSDELSETDKRDVLADMQRLLALLSQSLHEKSFVVLGQSPAEFDVANRIGNWLSALPRPILIAQAPNVQ